MKTICNERGIALITALLITLLSMVIVFGLIYMITQNTKMAASQKIYRNSVEASYGGTEVFVNQILPSFYKGMDPGDILDLFPPDMNMQFHNASCLQDKLLKASTDWSACTGDPTGINPRTEPDAKFELKGQSDQKYVVYTKIVDTAPGTPYISGIEVPLEGNGVVSSRGTNGAGRGQHYVYRLEVAGERATNPAEKGELTVLYEY